MGVEDETFSLAETRRQFIIENGSPFVIGMSDDPPSVIYILNTFSMIERWLIDGTVPTPPDSKTKLRVVKGEGDA